MRGLALGAVGLGFVGLCFVLSSGLQLLSRSTAQPSELASWWDLGSSLDLKVPNDANLKAADVGGKLVMEHAPSGKLPGFGGGWHFGNDMLHPIRAKELRSRFNRMRRSFQPYSAHQLREMHREEKEGIRFKSKDIHGVYRKLQDSLRVDEARRSRTDSKRPSSAEAEGSRGPAPQERYPDMAEVIKAYRRMQKFHTNTIESDDLRPVRAAEGSQEAPKGTTVEEAAKGHKALNAAAQGTTNAEALKSSIAEAEALEKAASSLDSLTASMHSGNFRASPERLAGIASDLSTLSSAIGKAPSPKESVSKERRPSRTGGFSTRSSWTEIRHSRAWRKRESEAGVGRPSAAQVKRREDKIMEDILYHLEKMKLEQKLVKGPEHSEVADTLGSWFLPVRRN